MRPSEPIPVNDVSCTTSMPTQLVTALPHTVNASGVQATTKDFSSVNEEDKFLKIVKNITSKGFVRSNYEEKLVDLSDVRINLKTKN